MPITVMHVAIVIVILLLCVVAMLIKYVRSNGSMNPCPIYKAGVVAVMMCAVFAGLVLIAMQHGLWTLNIPADDFLWTIVRNETPIDQSEKLPDDLSGSVVALYRFACPDCEAVHDDLQTWADYNDVPLWWVSSRSDAGRKLLGSSTIDKVPAILAFNTDGERIDYVAYEVDKDGHAILNKSALDHVLTFLNDAN